MYSELIEMSKNSEALTSKNNSSQAPITSPELIAKIEKELHQYQVKRRRKIYIGTFLLFSLMMTACYGTNAQAKKRINHFVTDHDDCIVKEKDITPCEFFINTTNTNCSSDLASAFQSVCEFNFLDITLLLLAAGLPVITCAFAINHVSIQVKNAKFSLLSEELQHEIKLFLPDVEINEHSKINLIIDEINKGNRQRNYATFSRV